MAGSKLAWREREADKAENELRQRQEHPHGAEEKMPLEAISHGDRVMPGSFGVF